jgi:hypothetical protein
VDDKTEEGIEELMERQDAIRYHSATTMPATQPMTEPRDPQFQQALTTMVGLVILDTNKHAATRP